MRSWGALLVGVGLMLLGTAAPAWAEAAPLSTQLDVPYRSQLDGSPYQSANCGPTAVAMALASFGVDASLWDLRVQAMKAQDSWVDSEGGYSDSYGVFIRHLATVVEGYGLRTYGLWRREGGGKIDRLRTWEPADIRAALRDGQPVVVGVRYRSLPGREDVPFYGDHYLVATGFEGDSFIYNDPVDRNGGGPDRVISAADLSRAMAEAQPPNAAFSVYQVSGP